MAAVLGLKLTHWRVIRRNTPMAACGLSDSAAEFSDDPNCADCNRIRRGARGPSFRPEIKRGEG